MTHTHNSSYVITVDTDVKDVFSPAVYKEYQEPYIELIENTNVKRFYYGEVQYLTLESAADAKSLLRKAESARLTSFKTIWRTEIHPSRPLDFIHRELFLQLPNESFHPSPREDLSNQKGTIYINHLDTERLWKTLIDDFLLQVPYFRSTPVSQQREDEFVNLRSYASYSALSKLYNAAMEDFLGLSENSENAVNIKPKLYELFRNHVIEDKTFIHKIKKEILECETALKEEPELDLRQRSKKNNPVNEKLKEQCKNHFFRLYDNKVGLAYEEIEEVWEKSDIYRVFHPMKRTHIDVPTESIAESRREIFIENDVSSVQALNQLMFNDYEDPYAMNAAMERPSPETTRCIEYLRRNFHPDDLSSIFVDFLWTTRRQVVELIQSNIERNSAVRLDHVKREEITFSVTGRAQRRFIVEICNVIDGSSGTLPLDFATNLVDQESIKESAAEEISAIMSERLSD